MFKRQPAVAALSCLATVLSLSSCSSGPTPPRMGTPEWYWSAAKEQFVAGDFAKTQEHLEKIMATTADNPYKVRATTWHLIVLGGMARGNQVLAEAYDAGSTSARSQAAEFRRTSMDMRRNSRQYVIGFTQESERIRKEMSTADKFTLDFGVPQGSPAEVSTLAMLRKGLLPQDSERAAAHRQTLARGILLQTAALVGAGEDTAKASEMFKSGPVEIPRAIFLCGLAECLVEQSALFDRRKLNEPDKRRVMLELAADFVKPAAESSDAGLKKRAKDLTAKIEKEQKSLPKI